MSVGEYIGNVNLFKLLSKVDTDTTTIATKAMEIPHVGCVVMTSIKPNRSDIPYAVTSCFVPGVKIVDNDNDNGRHLEAICAAYKKE